MRIDSKSVASVTSNEPRTPSGTAPGKPAAGDVVTLSSAGAAVGADTKSDPDITARIQQIRTQLAQGAYPIDLDKLASRIVDDEMLRGSK